MKCNEENFEKTASPQKGPAVNVKGRVITYEIVEYDHFKRICQVMISVMMNNFALINRNVINIFTEYIRNKCEYCPVVQSPAEQAKVSDWKEFINNTQAKLEGMEHMAYNELYSPEKRNICDSLCMEKNEFEKRTLGLLTLYHKRSSSIRSSRISWNISKRH